MVFPRRGTSNCCESNPGEEGVRSSRSSCKPTRLPETDDTGCYRPGRRSHDIPVSTCDRLCGDLLLLWAGLRLQRHMLRRIHRVLLHDVRRERVSVGDRPGRLVEGRWLGGLRQWARRASSLLHRLQYLGLRHLWVWVQRDLFRRLSGRDRLHLWMRSGKLRSSKDLLHRVSVRAVQSKHHLRRSDRMPRRDVHPPVAMG